MSVECLLKHFNLLLCQSICVRTATLEALKGLIMKFDIGRFYEKSCS
jgi:hypothetical protein